MSEHKLPLDVRKRIGAVGVTERHRAAAALAKRYSLARRLAQRARWRLSRGMAPK